GYAAQDIRFTTKGGTLYAIVMAWPDDGKVTIKSLAQGGLNAEGSIGSVKLLGSDSAVRFTRDSNGLHLQLPAKTGQYAFVFKISR
ncbi:MAG: alpha-L-fucosidase, partial [Acidobacteriaceae bacterium]|nr:alpha-L-fucosidase [Acidobacteriaceae bacterium]